MKDFMIIKLFRRLLQKKLRLLAIIFSVITFILIIWYFIPQGKESKNNSSAIIMRCSYTQLMVNGKDILNYDPDTIYIKAAWVNHFSTIPSCFGLLMSNNDVKEKEFNISSDSIHSLMKMKLDSLEHRMDSIHTVYNELEYYIRVHDVHDEGFMTISNFASKITQRMDTLKEEIKVLKTIKKGQNLSLQYKTSYIVYYPDDSLKLQYASCHPTKVSRNKKYRYYQTDESHTPSAVSKLRRKSYFKDIKDKDFINHFGFIAQKAICRLYPYYNIPFKKGHKDDKGIIRIVNGKMVSGKWNADTLVHGMRIDSMGIYIGEMNRNAVANGNGLYIGKEPSYYEGFWKNDKRQGFGYAIAPNKPLRVGEWKDDRYKGERVNYTSNRIYGIDISRYQHDYGFFRERRCKRIRRHRRKYYYVSGYRHHYSIDWSSLRISGLGSLSKKNISGHVDYPISFIYIKSTEGTSLYNNYYANDYAGARAHGIRTGSYHFFSTVSKASSQAYFFIRNSKFNKGDFPPVLDVEPMPSQIRKMGGAHELWNRIRVWLHIVEKSTGVKPVLYISQTFVNRYINLAPDIKRDYKVWIARYGEYKPDVRLVYWQLAPDGRVKGIHGEVDINVFNGYKSEYREFLAKDCIK